MKIVVTLYRVAVFPTTELHANLNTIAKLTDSLVEEALRDRFGTLAPRFKIFGSGRKSMAGMEAMTFDLQVEGTLQAGLVMSDPMEPKEVDRLDGALRGELERLGIHSEIQNYEWRMHYTMKGN